MMPRHGSSIGARVSALSGNGLPPFGAKVANPRIMAGCTFLVTRKRTVTLLAGPLEVVIRAEAPVLTWGKHGYAITVGTD